MIPMAATHVAAPLRIFITNEGTHSAEHWAIVTAHSLVSEGANISPDRIAACRDLQRRAVATLTEAFHSVHAASSFDAIAITASAAALRIVDHAKGTPWEMEFGHPAILAMMEDVVCRNLATHADIALRTE